MLTVLKADVKEKQSHISIACQSDLCEPQHSGWGRVDLTQCSISCISVLLQNRFKQSNKCLMRKAALLCSCLPGTCLAITKQPTQPECSLCP